MRIENIAYASIYAVATVASASFLLMSASTVAKCACQVFYILSSPQNCSVLLKEKEFVELAGIGICAMLFLAYKCAVFFKRLQFFLNDPEKGAPLPTITIIPDVSTCDKCNPLFFPF